jgi:sodium-dependent dicarboxylate transporter 2/3/5
MPWGALILLGAGLAVAQAFEVCWFEKSMNEINGFLFFKASKLSESVARALRFLAGISRAAVILLIIIISGLFTEVTSNLSTASIFFPVLDSVVSWNVPF